VRKVCYDIEEGWITRERAFQVYGVAIGENGQVDAQATAARRKALASAGTHQPSIGPPGEASA
jgi:hypothetical protein